MLVKNNSSESLSHHIDDLRLTLIQILATVLAGIIISFLFYPKVIEYLTTSIKTEQSNIIQQEMKREKILNKAEKEYLYHLPDGAHLVYLSPTTKEVKPNIYSIPLEGYLIVDSAIANKLMIFGPTEGIFTVFKLCFWLGLVGTFPVWSFFLLRFIYPALNSIEKRLLIPFSLLSLCFIILGFLFAYFLMIPFANDYLSSFNQNLGVNLWSLANYLDYSIQLLLSTAFAFEIAVVGVFLVHFEFISKEKMATNRKYAIVGSLILGALLTPPDIFSQLMLAMPLIGFYEALILYAKSKNRKKIHL